MRGGLYHGSDHRGGHQLVGLIQGLDQAGGSGPGPGLSHG
jgi:hypothetical protein